MLLSFIDCYLEIVSKVYPRDFPAASTLVSDADQWLKNDEPVILSVLQLKPKCKDNIYVL